VRIASDNQNPASRRDTGLRILGLQSVLAESLAPLDNFPVCPALRQHHIADIGIQEGRAPTRIVRPVQTNPCFVTCCSGKARVRFGERWQVFDSGFACLLPAHRGCAFESVPGASWKFCWVSYDRSIIDNSVTTGSGEPRPVRYDPLPLQLAIAGLVHECSSLGEPGVIQHWTDLIHQYVSRFTHHDAHPDTLSVLWERVTANLASDWSLDRLAREAGYSGEHLRRMCQARLGRSPMQQVSFLRMRRAAELLTSTELTIEAIAREVGYENPFVFSNAFTKRIGWRPSEYRRKRVNGQRLSQAV
jgi:AraC-like DNA-binding protein